MHLKHTIATNFVYRSQAIPTPIRLSIYFDIRQWSNKHERLSTPRFEVSFNMIRRGKNLLPVSGIELHMIDKRSENSDYEVGVAVRIGFLKVEDRFQFNALTYPLSD